MCCGKCSFRYRSIAKVTVVLFVPATPPHPSLSLLCVERVTHLLVFMFLSLFILYLSSSFHTGTENLDFVRRVNFTQTSLSCQYKV